MNSGDSAGSVEARARERVGTTLGGKYRLDRLLGVGGTAAVYAATHRNKAQLAVKVLHPELGIRADIRRRFLREGYVANSVAHPGVVRVLDDATTEDGSVFVVMELLRGESLDELWKRAGARLPAAVVAVVGDQVLDVLAAAHARGIVHRDIKPANLFVSVDGNIRVLDFGIARLRDQLAAGSVATQTGMALGTPAFMAPEQALAEASEIDARTDLWAVGATLFALASGQHVHEGDNAQQIMVRAATRRAPTVGTVAPDLPAPLAEVIDRALAFEKVDRWGDASSMRDALRKGYQDAFGVSLDGAVLRELVTEGGTTGGREPSARERLELATTLSSTHDPSSLGRPARRPLLRWAILVVALACVAGSAEAVRLASSHGSSNDRTARVGVGVAAAATVPSCGDTSLDARNCGACGHDCLGGACEQGACQPLALARDVDVYAVALDDEYVYASPSYTTAGHPPAGIFRVSKRGGTPEIVAADTRAWGIALHGGDLYATSRGLLRVPLDGGTSEQLVRESIPPNVVAIGATRAYFTATQRGTVVAVPLDGGRAEVINDPLRDGGTQPVAVVVDDAGRVFWDDQVLGEILTPAPPQAPYVLAGDQHAPYGIATDGEYVYWANSGAIRKVPSRGGGNVVTLATSSEGSYYLAVDADDVYWTNQNTQNYRQGSNQPGPNGSVNRVSKTGGPPTTLATGQRNPAGIAVDATAVYWAENEGRTLWKLAK